eukprot:6694564-Alexandrium_andersonii.AAC.2
MATPRPRNAHATICNPSSAVPMPLQKLLTARRLTNDDMHSGAQPTSRSKHAANLAGHRAASSKRLASGSIEQQKAV